MSGFVAANVEPPRYDFTKFGGGAGCIRETSPDDRKRLRSALTEPNALTEEQGLSASAREAVAEFCGGRPTSHDIATLPPDVQLAFVGWLIGLAAGPALVSAGTVDV